MKPELEITHNTLPQLFAQIEKMKHRTGQWGRDWSDDSVHKLNEEYRNHLATQGRGGEPPPLSPMTRYLYSQIGEPSGSGIRDHIRIDYHQHDSNNYTAVFGILEGQPTIVAKVQDDGAIIPVTEKMRNFLAVYGIFLRAETTQIVIPARHSWEYSLRSASDTAKKRLRRFWTEILR